MGNNTAYTCQDGIDLMGGNAAHWIDQLEAWGEASTMFPDFKYMIIDYYIPLDNKNIAWY